MDKGIYLVPVISSFLAGRRRAALPWQCQGELGEGRAWNFLNREGSSTEAAPQGRRQAGAAKWARWKPKMEKKYQCWLIKAWQNHCNDFGSVQLLLSRPSLGLLRAFLEGLSSDPPCQVPRFKLKINLFFLTEGHKTPWWTTLHLHLDPLCWQFVKAEHWNINYNRSSNFLPSSSALQHCQFPKKNQIPLKTERLA